MTDPADPAATDPAGSAAETDPVATDPAGSAAETDPAATDPAETDPAEVERLEVWRRLRALVTDRLDAYRHRVVAVTGLPFSRVRALRRLADGPLTPSRLAASMMVDRPAVSVAVDDLCALGLVERRAHTTDRRRKLVSLTEAGARMVERVEAVVPPPPDGWAGLPAGDLAALRRVLDALDG